MDNFNYLRAKLPGTFDFSKRKVINNSKVLELPSFDSPSHWMDQLRVRNFVTNPPLPRQIPSIEEVEAERLRQYGMRVTMDPTVFAEKLGNMVLKLPRVDNAGKPIKDQTGRLVFKYYTFQEMMKVPFLRQFRMSQLRTGGVSDVGNVFEEEAIGDANYEASIVGLDKPESQIFSDTSDEQKQTIDEKQKEEQKAALAEGNVLLAVEDEQKSKMQIATHKLDKEVQKSLNTMVDSKQPIETHWQELNTLNKKNSTLCVFISNQLLKPQKIVIVGGQALPPSAAYLTFLNIVINRAGNGKFNLMGLLALMEQEDAANYLPDDDDLVGVRMVMNYTPEAAQRMMDARDAGSPLSVSINTMNSSAREDVAMLWSMLWNKYAKVPFGLLRRAFTFFAESTYGADKAFEYGEASMEFGDTGGPQFWEQERAKASGL
ncbi:MAG: hypothetical protein GY938_29485 [Ketobacter sp.]|nr:hypothetical protein [Ketobacter sp.]